MTMVPVMTMYEPLDVETIRRIVGYLREGGAPAFTSDRYTTTIDPFWFSTPVRRGVLWEAIARMVALEERAPTGAQKQQRGEQRGQSDG